MTTIENSGANEIVVLGLIDEQIEGGRFLTHLQASGYRSLLLTHHAKDAADALRHTEFDLLIVYTSDRASQLVETIARARSTQAPCGCIVVGRSADERLRAVQTAAADFILATADRARFEEARRRGLGQTLTLRRLAEATFLEGGGGEGEDARTCSVGRMRALTAAYRLTSRQIQALSLVANGLTDDEIADALLITRRGVRRLMEAGLVKLGVRSRREFLGFIWRHPAPSTTRRLGATAGWKDAWPELAETAESGFISTPVPRPSKETVEGEAQP